MIARASAHEKCRRSIDKCCDGTVCGPLTMMVKEIENFVEFSIGHTHLWIGRACSYNGIDWSQCLTGPQCAYGSPVTAGN